MSWYKKVTDKIPGGLSDGRSPEEFNQVQLNDGIKVELEHTSDVNIATEIAMDHLTEDPLYYEKLKTIETHSFNFKKIKTASDNLNCLYDVLNKPLDYLPLKHLTNFDRKNMESWAKSKGLTPMYLYGREPSGSLYIYNPPLLTSLLTENEEALRRAGVPVNPADFVTYIDSNWVSDSDAYLVIDEAFGRAK
jgi:hypothetical protein